MVKFRIGDTFQVYRNKKVYAGVCVSEIGTVEDIGAKKTLNTSDINFFPIITDKKKVICLDSEAINGDTRVVLTEKLFKPLSEQEVYFAYFEMKKERKIEITIKSGIDMMYESSVKFGIPRGKTTLLLGKPSKL